MNTNKSVTANFALIPLYTLTISIIGQGSVTPPGGSYSSNTVVALTASSSNGWQFLGWRGGAQGSDNPLYVTMTRNKSIIATFVQLPAILSQPQSVTVAVGDAVTFGVTATGTPPLTYQWWFINSPIAAATNASIKLPNVQPWQVGEYSVVVANPYGTATSQPAALSIPNACSGSNVLMACDEAGLRAAMSRGGTVRFCCNGTITLSNAIDVTRNVSLDASDRAVVISGNNPVRLFNVSAGVTFALTNVVLANGHHQGKDGVNASATQPATSGEPGIGGAIYNSGGNVQLVSCVLSNNQARGGMGGAGSQQLRYSAPGADGRGGALFNGGGTMVLQNILAVGNAAAGGQATIPAPSGDGLGGVLYNAGGTITIANSALTGNTAEEPTQTASAVVAARGGAVYQASGSLSITGSTFVGNSAFGAQNVSGGYPPSDGDGGALYVASGTLRIEQSLLLNNRAVGGSVPSFVGGVAAQGRGGAIYSEGASDIRGTTFSSNAALGGTGGGGMYSEGQGGGLYNAGIAVLNGDTFESNRANGGAGPFDISLGGGAGGDGLGGGIFNRAALTATSCTIAGNQAQG